MKVKKKLSLKKFKIAKLNNPQNIFGGETVQDCGGGTKSEPAALCNDDTNGNG